MVFWAYMRVGWTGGFNTDDIISCFIPYFNHFFQDRSSLTYFKLYINLL